MPFSNKRSLAECVIGLLADAPGPGQFSGERVLGPNRADFIIGLCARRVSDRVQIFEQGSELIQTG